MYDDTSGKVDNAPSHKESLRMPRHVSQWAVDDEKEEHHEKQICRETYPLGKRPCDKRGCDDGKLHLEQGEECQRNGCPTQYISCRRRVHFCPYVLEHQEGQRIAYNASDVIAKA